MKSKYNWAEIQESYDSGLSQRQLIEQYGMSTRSFLLAVKRGDFKSRTRSEACILDRRNNPRTSESLEEHGRRTAKTIAEKVAAGTWHTSLAKYMHISYNGVDLHGSWELEYAKYLDANSIKWIRNKDTFSYTYDGKDRKYTPDFYLTETDEYIEIKGYKTEKDTAKWLQFPLDRKLKVLMKKELCDLGIKVKV